MSGRPVALVTGSSRGIGKGIVLQLAQNGYDVVINYAGNLQAAEQTRDEAAALGCRAEIIQASISNPDDRTRLIDTTIEQFGRLDLLVNNAGIPTKYRGDLLELTEDSYDTVMETNLKGPFFLTQYAAKKLIELQAQNKIETARIIFISSISAYTASINRGDYCISKAGLSMVTALFADRLAQHNIFVYEIRPGIIASDMTSGVKEKYDKLIAEGLTPQPRWGQPDDIGKAVCAVASGAFDFSTGTVIDVDGGFHLRRL